MNKLQTFIDNENVSLIEKNNDVRIFLYTYGFVLKICSMYLLTAMAYFQYITNKNETKSQRKTSKKNDSRFKKGNVYKSISTIWKLKLHLSEILYLQKNVYQKTFVPK